MSFKAIKLNESEQKKSDNLMNSLKVAPEQKTDTIKFQLYELYDKHLQKEVDEKCKSYHIKEDFAQEMFLKFFESLENVRKNILPIEEFIPLMNKVKPSKDELKSGITETSIDQNIGSTEIVIKDRLVDDDLPQYIGKKNEEERKIVQDEFDKVINESTLKNIESKILKEKSTGKTLQNIADELKLSKTTITRYYHGAIYKIQDENNSLPKDVESFVSEFAKTYEIKDVSTIKKAFMTNPFILSAGMEKISKNISEVSTMLEFEEKEFVKSGLKRPQLFLHKPETLKENVKNSSKLFNIEEKDFIKAGLKQPQLFYQRPETLKENVKKSALLLEISEKEFIGASLKQPQLFYQKPETIKQNVERSAELFKTSKKEFVKASLKQPTLFYKKPETLKEAVENTSNIMGVAEKEFIKIALKHPTLFYEKAETLKENVKNSAELFEISEKEFIKAGLRHPQLFYQRPETLKENVETSANLLELSEKEFVKASLRQPSLFYQKPETIKQNVEKSAEIFEISEKEFIKASLKQPQLFYQKPETLKENIKNSSKLFEIDENEFTKIALSWPVIFYQKSETLDNNITQIAKILNVEKKDIINLAKSKPAMFLLKPENTAKKIKLAKYYNEIKGKNNDKLRFYTNTQDVYFEDNIAYLVKKCVKEEKITQKNFKNYLLNNPDKSYTFELPESEFNEEFMQFTNDYFNNLVGKCNVQFVIKQNKKIK